MSKYHIVQQGECLSRIAVNYGFRDYRTIYEDAGNVDFRKKRPDPNLIFPGDKVLIPDKKVKQVACGTGNQHVFTVRKPKRILKIALESLDGKRLENAPYELVVEGATYKGKTNGQGVLEQRIPMDAEDGQLKLAGHEWKLHIAHLNPIRDTPDVGISGIQMRLTNLGYDPGPIDGIAGPRTKRAIMSFQCDHSLKVDGICGPVTTAKLIEIHGC